jgi:hypothetical protein
MEKFYNKSRDEYRPPLIFIYEHSAPNSVVAVVLNIHENSICYFNEVLGNYVETCGVVFASYPTGRLNRKVKFFTRIEEYCRSRGIDYDDMHGMQKDIKNFMNLV